MKTSDERIQSINDKVKTKRKRRALIWTASSVACVLLVLTVVCSLPILGQGAPNVNAYRGVEYYPIISKINESYSDERYSIFGSLAGGLLKGYGSASPDDGAMAPTDPMPDSPSNEDDGASNRYEETTLNQVNGVIEGDLLKRSSTHAFYLKNGYLQNAEPCLLLQVYRLAGSDTACVTEYYIRPQDGTSFHKYGNGYIDAEMFLSSDADRLTVITTCLSEERVVYTTVVSLDVSNVGEITEVNRVYVSGKYLSSRIIDGKLLVITNFNAGRYGYYGYDTVDYDKKETYVPQCGSNLGYDYVAMSNIYIPDNCGGINYTVLALLDEKTLASIDSYAVFSYTQDVYVSRDYIVVMRNRSYRYQDSFQYGKEIEEIFNSKPSVYTRVCEIVAISYKDGFEQKGEIGLEGGIKDRYAMDEKDGVLRVFTTTDRTKLLGGNASSRQINVNLYCVDLSDMHVAASKQSFAPAGDEVKSVRFDGDKAYVCTARLNTDPVFCFDLSDLNNITCVDTGEIEGFSVNLIKFNDLLLGIGQGANNGLKVELYSESDDENAENGVVSVAIYEQQCGFSPEPKAHFVNAEHGLVGLHVYDYTESWVSGKPNVNRNKYLLLRYDGEKLERIYLQEFDSSSDLVRAFYADGYVYVFGTNAFAIIEL